MHTLPIFGIPSYILLGLLLVAAMLSPQQSPAQVPDTLGLEVFVRLATQQALASKTAAVRWRQAQHDYQIFRAGLKPQLLGRANFPNYFRTYNETIQPNGSISFQPVTLNNSAVSLQLAQEIPQTGGLIYVATDLQRFDNFETGDYSYKGLPLRIGIQQPLFGFNPMQWERQLAPLRLQVAEKQYAAARAGLRREATPIFFELLEAYQSREMARANRAANQTLYEVAKERFALGKLSRGDLVQLELELVSAEKDEGRAEQAFRAASATLLVYIGRTWDGQTIVPRLSEPTASVQVDVEQALQRARTQRPEADAWQQARLEAAREVAAARRTDGLQLDIGASFGWVRTATDVGSIYSQPQSEQIIGAHLRVPILDWGQRRARIDRARLSQELTEREAENDLLALEAQLRQTVADFEQLQTELQLMKKIRQLAEERMQISTDSYLLGAISLTEWTLAQREKDRASREYVTTLRRYWMVVADLQWLIVEEDGLYRGG